MKALRLTEIWIYPIKSLGGISLSTSQVLPKGLAYDRRWMLVDEHGVFMTQRMTPQMALFKLSIEPNHLLIKYRDQSLALDIKGVGNEQPEDVKIWDDTVTSYEVSKQHSEWFSQILGMRCKLMSFPENNPRSIDPEFKVNDEHVSLADAFPFLIIGESSLNDLNTRLSHPVPMNRFRPNFVFSEGNAYEEDTWRNCTIGNNRFMVVKPCARCVVTTVDQKTSEKSAEPLKTLSTYRKANNNKVYFGQNMVAIDHGRVSVGEVIHLN